MPVVDFVRRTPEEVLWPLNEAEKKHAPAALFLAGDPELIRTSPCVSIVGSQQASKEGLARAARLARILVDRGVVVLSGLAIGIDTAALVAAIEHGGRTVAVLGTPLDQCFPPKNRELQHRIMRDHLVVSQFPQGLASGRYTFPIRDRTMALLSHATVIVEATDTSGCLNQAWEALRLRRPLFLARSIFDNLDLRFLESLALCGGKVLCDESVKYLLELLPRGGGAAGQYGPDDIFDGRLNSKPHAEAPGKGKGGARVALEILRRRAKQLARTQAANEGLPQGKPAAD